MSEPVKCPECGHEVKLRSTWFGGAGGLGGGMGLIPSNSVIRCPACGHVFQLPKDAPLGKQPLAAVVIGVILTLVLAALLLVLVGGV